MYRVRWERRALDELTDHWIQADSLQRRATTAAVHRIDKRLQADAPDEGESRAQGRRIVFEPPLAVTFRIEPDGRTVSVLQARFFRRRV
jgi:hypothetical protein